MSLDPRGLLARPRLYSLFRRFVGRDSARAVYAREHLRLTSGDRVLDLGCGPADILAFLPEVHYVGYDASAAYIARARARFGARGEFHCHPLAEDLAVPPRSFDAVIAHGLLHHLDDDGARVLFRVAKHALRAGGRLVTFDGCFSADQGSAARLLLSLDRGRYVRTRDGYERLARAEFGEVSSFVRHDLLRLPYTHLIMECIA